MDKNLILGDVAETTSPINPADYQAYEVILLLFDSKCRAPHIKTSAQLFCS